MSAYEIARQRLMQSILRAHTGMIIVNVDDVRAVLDETETRRASDGQP